MLARESVITFIDFETTGVVDRYPDEPWQIGIVQLKNGHIDSSTKHTSLLRVPPRPFSPHAPGRHEQLREEITQAPSLPELWSQLGPILTSGPLAAHNASTEKRVLRKAFPMHPMTSWIDTLRLARLAFPERSSHRLSDLVEGMELHPRVEDLVPGRSPHDALYDAVASAALLEAFLDFPEWKDVTMDALLHARESNFRQALARKRKTPGSQ
jgi:DNA polymerase III epsilon subunit-like protein